ncbi:Nop14-like family [Novymonas esmeraldas]|uniref:Nop14-like family n=1 Tax=Novymonas esmeraldas TaxID=1808958 RepID=A0AAW0EWC0_9TRYP
MVGSRSTSNAALVRRHQRRQSSALAEASVNKFTQQQSRFERRREEEQAQLQHSDARGGGGGGGVAGRTAGDALLSGRGGRGDHGATAATAEDVRETPNPFAQRRSAAAGVHASATTRSATMGLDKVAPRSTRSTRRIDRFSLTSHADAAAAPAPSSHMGVRRVREEDGAEGSGSGSGAPPPAKVSRAERFRAMIANSKGQRAQVQRERAERDAAAVKLDAALEDLLPLLSYRNKLAEEKAAFADAGTPELRALLESYRRGHEAKCLTLRSSGAFAVHTLTEAARAGASAVRAASAALPAQAERVAEEATFLDSADLALLARIRRGTARSAEETAADEAAPPPPPPPPPRTRTRAAAADAAAVSTAGGGGDDFDSMMFSFMMDPRRARAVPRTLTEEEEELQAARQDLLMADRQQVPSLQLQERDQTQRTRGEWVAQGGDVAYQMDAEEAEAGEDNVDIPSSIDADGDDDGDDVDVVDGEEEGGAGSLAEAADAQRVGGSATLERLLQQLEEVAAAAPTGAAPRSARLHALLVQLHQYAARHVVEVTKAFRVILVEAERAFLRGAHRSGVRHSLLVCLYAITKVFPTSDYRHAVVTPLLLFLCSALTQMRLDSLDAVHSVLIFATLLVHCLKAGAGRYCAEAVTAVVNVLALQLPRAALEPARYQGTALPVPLLQRTEDVLLDSSAAAPAAAAVPPPHRLGLFDTAHSPERLLLCAYALLGEVCDLHRTTAAFPVMCARPLLELDALLLRPESAWAPSTAVRLAHEALTVKVRDMATRVEDHRTPLAMRTFRPRPLRQFDPLLAEREENAAKNEVRIMKRDMREDKKRLMRHLTAEATVQRRAQEKRHAVDDAQRERRYHSVLHQLQQQQHSMNAVESLKARAKSKVRKGLSGAPTTKPADDAGGD